VIIKLISNPSSTKKTVDYLFGGGDANEHTDQHIVSSSGTLHLDLQSESIEKQKQVMQKFVDEFTPGRVRSDSKHLMHFTFSLPAGDVELLDNEWDDVAQEYAKLMGFDEHGVQWVAVRHGLSKGGNDHIHLLTNRYSIDGKMWNDSFSKQRTADAAKKIEEKFPFLVKHLGQSDVRTEQAYTAKEFSTYAEQLAYQRWISQPENEGKDFFDLSEKERNKLIWNIKSYELPRRKLQGMVRAAAMSSKMEDEFIRRLRSSGVLLKPRFDRNNPSQVIGYSVALRFKDSALPEGTRSHWYGGNKLANDLSIKRLRMNWAGVPDPSEADISLVEQTIFETDSKAYDEWKAAQEHRPTVHNGEENWQPEQEDFDRVNDQLGKLRDKLKQSHASGDFANMARTSRYVSAALSSMSERFDFEGSPMNRFALTVAIAAQTRNNARLSPPLDLTYEALLGANRIFRSSSNDYQAMLNLMRIMFEIAMICQENYYLEQELRRARTGVETLKSELLEPLKMDDVVNVSELRERIKTAEDLQKADIYASRTKDDYEEELRKHQARNAEPSDDYSGEEFVEEMQKEYEDDYQRGGSSDTKPGRGVS
jgi:hypothetical protein